MASVDRFLKQFLAIPFRNDQRTYLHRVQTRNSAVADKFARRICANAMVRLACWNTPLHIWVIMPNLVVLR